MHHDPENNIPYELDNSLSLTLYKKIKFKKHLLYLASSAIHYPEVSTGSTVPPKQMDCPITLKHCQSRLISKNQKFKISKNQNNEKNYIKKRGKNTKAI